MKNIQDNYLLIIEKIMKLLPEMSKEQIIWYSRSDTEIMSDCLKIDKDFEIIKEHDPEYLAISSKSESTLLDLNKYLRKDFRFDYDNPNTNSQHYLKKYSATDRRVVSKYKTKCDLSKEELIHLMGMNPEDRNICFTPAQIVELIIFKANFKAKRKDFRIEKENWIIPILDVNHRITFMQFDNFTHDLFRLFSEKDPILRMGYLFI